MKDDDRKRDDENEHDEGAMYRRTAPRIPVTGAGPSLQTGVTPGLRRADEDLMRDVETRLEHDDARTEHVVVTCTDGVVELHGKIPDEQEHERVRDLAAAVQGVREVVDRIEVDHRPFRRFLDAVDTKGEVHEQQTLQSRSNTPEADLDADRGADAERKSLCRASPSAEARGLKRCAHAPCSCPVEVGQDYCSEECHRGALAGHNNQVCACRCGVEN